MRNVFLGLLLFILPLAEKAQNSTNAFVFSHLAGSLGGPGYIDGIGTNARFMFPCAVAVDSDGAMYVADEFGHTIRKVSLTGVVTTFAGTPGQQGSADGLGAAASFNDPVGIAVDAAGNVYVADEGSDGIRKISPAGETITLPGLADGSASPSYGSLTAITVDRAGNIFVAYLGTIRKITPQGTVTTIAGVVATPYTIIQGNVDGTGSNARFSSFIYGLAVDTTGNIFVADSGNQTIRKVTPAGVVTTIAGQPGITGSTDGTGAGALFNNPYSIAIDSAGTLFIADGNNGLIRKMTPSGVVTTLAGNGQIGSSDGTGSAAQFSTVMGIALTSSGEIVVGDAFNSSIRKVTRSGVVTTFSGLSAQVGSLDGFGPSARFNDPTAVVVDKAGNSYIADTGNNLIRKITADGTVSTFAGTAGLAGAIDGTGSAARFNSPEGIAVDGIGNVYVSDANNNVIRKISPTGVVTTLAGNGLRGQSDGTGSEASFWQPHGIAVDDAGNVFVADAGNHLIRKITPSGVVSTLVGTLGGTGSTDGNGGVAVFNYPTDLAIDEAKNIYVVDGNNTLLKMTPAGVVTTVALWIYNGIAVDSAGNVYSATDDETIIKVTADGTVTTIAGTFDQPGNTDGVGSVALFNHPIGIAIDSGGSLYITDSGNNSIRKGTLVPPAITLSADPSSQSAKVGKQATFSVTASSDVPLTYQWQCLPVGASTWLDLTESDTYSGTTASTLTVNAASIALSGIQFRCRVSNGVVADLTSASATLAVITSVVTTSQLINLSTRSLTQTSDNVQIAGFVIVGSKPKNVLIRASGPSMALSAPSLAGVLTDPALFLYSKNVYVTANLVWGTATNAADIKAAAALVGAAAWADGSKDSAILMQLAPGAYTAQVVGASGKPGISLVEVYDADGDADTRLINISTRSFVGTGDNLQIAGFVITGSGPKQVLIRASGPALNSAIDPSKVLADPALTLIGQGRVLGSNIIWGSAPNWPDIEATAKRVGAFDWVEGSKDSAILISLAPGIYTAIVSGASGDTGVDLVEVYDAD